MAWQQREENEEKQAPTNLHEALLPQRQQTQAAYSIPAQQIKKDHSTFSAQVMPQPYANKLPSTSASKNAPPFTCSSRLSGPFDFVLFSEMLFVSLRFAELFADTTWPLSTSVALTITSADPFLQPRTPRPPGTNQRAGRDAIVAGVERGRRR